MTTDQQPEAPAPTLARQLTEAADTHRENLLYTAPEFCDWRWDEFRERLRDIAAGCKPAPDPPVMPQDDEATRMLTDFMGLPEPSPRPAEPVAGSRETAGGLSVAAALDRDGLREIIMAAAERGAGPWTAGERITDAVWPLLEHAQEAAAGSHEGVRLWMTDCYELTAKHARRAEAAEAKLAVIEAACRNPGQAAGRCMGGIHVPGDRLAGHILAIISTEEEAQHSPAARTAERVTVSLECGHEGWIYSDETAVKLAWCGACEHLRAFTLARDVGTEGDSRG